MKRILAYAAPAVCLAAATLAAQSAQVSVTPSGAQASASVTTSGEPTQQDMRGAVQATIDDYNKSMKQKVDNCRNGQNQANPILAAQCLAVYANGSTDSNDYMVKITKFKKVSCAPASGKPGYNCDYVVNLSETTPTLLGMLGLTTHTGGTTHGRFLHNDDGWALTTDTSP